MAAREAVRWVQVPGRLGWMGKETGQSQSARGNKAIELREWEIAIL